MSGDKVAKIRPHFLSVSQRIRRELGVRVCELHVCFDVLWFCFLLYLLINLRIIVSSLFLCTFTMLSDHPCLTDLGLANMYGHWGTQYTTIASSGQHVCRTFQQSR